ncbi:hypothetical protein M405DRAFT_878842 [Rhizopogon salebrosus TDB-379]|nr:hypothetical protein M405DRAFT_878842 [Rhizopogon salebrosus TDB-379]
MPVTSPTLVPRPPVIPLVLPRAPYVNPSPLPKLDRYPGRMDIRRDFQREIEDLSDEETELEEATIAIRDRGFQWLIPIGRHTTKQEEKNEAEDESEGSDTGQSGGGAPSVNEDGEENDESGPDLDASMEDMDEEGETGSDAEDVNDATDDLEERSSDA